MVFSFQGHGPITDTILPAMKTAYDLWPGGPGFTRSRLETGNGMVDAGYKWLQHIYIYTHTYIYVCVYVCMYVCIMYVCMSICVCVRIYHDV